MPVRVYIHSEDEDQVQLLGLRFLTQLSVRVARVNSLLRFLLPHFFFVLNARKTTIQTGDSGSTPEVSPEI